MWLEGRLTSRGTANGIVAVNVCGVRMVVPATKVTCKWAESNGMSARQKPREEGKKTEGDREECGTRI